MKFTILAATEDLDGAAERAPVGKRYLHLSIHITDNGAGSANEFLPEFLRLSIDGAPYVPEHMSDNNVIASHSSQDDDVLAHSRHRDPRRARGGQA